MGDVKGGEAGRVRRGEERRGEERRGERDVTVALSGSGGDMQARARGKVSCPCYPELR